MWHITSDVYLSPQWLGQDRIVVRKLSDTLTLTAVLDGFGENSYTVNAVAKTLSTQPLDPPATRFARAAWCRAVVRALCDANAMHEDGCTLTLALLYADGFGSIATLGDSPWLLKDGPEKVVGGPVHNVATHKGDRATIEAQGWSIAGAYVRKGYHGLQLSRAIGAREFKGVLIQEPSMRHFSRRRRGDWLCLMSDGVWDASGTNARTYRKALVQDLCTGRDAAHIVAHHGLQKCDDRAAIVCRYVG